jgi:drug/metabolite transporter (DMT)-like permease
VVWFRGPIAEHGAWAVNLGKGLIATSLLGLTALALGELDSLGTVSSTAIWAIIASGVIGLSIGDTALFAAVDRIGPHRSLLFQTFAPVFAATGAYFAFGERLVPGQMAGAVLVLAGVVLVVAGPDSGFRISTTGALLAIVAAAGQGFGVVFAKAGMAELPTVAASFFRMLAGTVGVLLIIGPAGRWPKWKGLCQTPGSLRKLAGPVVLGTYFAFLLMMAGVAVAPASIASTLLATTPIFGLFIDARLGGAPITRRGILGTLLAVAGVGIMTLA